MVRACKEEVEEVKEDCCKMLKRWGVNSVYEFSDLLEISNDLGL